jgi:hypothetical protein
VADVCSHGVDTGFVDLGYAKVAVLGVVQGVTELLPISSMLITGLHSFGLRSLAQSRFAVCEISHKESE